MRILIISDVTSWMRGGVPAETRALVRGLTDQGHAVALATDAPLTGAEAALHMSITIPVGKSLTSEIDAALRAFCPDFVHVLCMNSRGLISMASCLRGYAWALTVHSVPPYENKLLGWHRYEPLYYWLRALRYLPNSLAWKVIFRMGLVPRVIVHSAFVGNIVAQYGYPKERIETIPLFFVVQESREERLSSKGPVPAPLLLTVGGITHTKGQLDVLKALPDLLMDFPSLHFQMAGEIRDDSYVRALRSLAAELGIENCISITPNLSNEELKDARLRAEVYVQPSHEEGFCLAFAEAAAEIPRLVGTATGAIAEISAEDPGASVVPVRDPVALGKAIAYQLRVTLPRNHMEGRLQRLSRRFSYSRYIKAHEELYSNRRADRDHP